jgi:hypothetical protein
MRDAPWKTLVHELTSAGYESPYLDHLRQRLDVSQAHEQLEVEIVREMAAALGRAEAKVVAALLRLELAGKALDAAEGPPARARCAAEFDARRRDALRARWELAIQREAVGLRRNAILDQLYPIPPAAPALSAPQPTSPRR